MKLKHSHRTIIYVFLVLEGLLLSFPIARNFYFAQEKIATQKAIEACNPAYGLKPVEQPSETHAYLDFYWGSLVWVVDMKGKWMLVGGPPPEPENPGPFYWDKCTIMIDALTGAVKSTPIE